MAKTCDVMSRPDANEVHGCGWSWFSPKCLRKFAVFNVFMFVLSINAIIQGMMVNGFISTSISSIEKRFNLSSTKSGVFSATYDVAVAIMLIPLSYYAHRVNKVRCIGYGMFMVGIGALLLILPHFIDGLYVVGALRSDVCDATRENSSCDSRQAAAAYSYPLLLLSQLFIGFGAAPLFTYGYSTIDEFDSHKKTGNNMAIFMGVSTVGPALAFIGGGYLLTIWGDIGKSNYLDFGINGPSDPRWYGAWWIGFLAAGLASFVTSLPLCMFPRKLNDTDERKKNDVVQTHAKLNVDFSGDKFAYFKIFKMFFFNKTCMALIAMQTAESMIMNGYITFIPKLFENLFGFSSSWASTMTGLIIVPMGLIGSFMGGKLGERVENRFRPIMKMCMALTVMMVISSTAFLLGCPKIRIAGMNNPYERTDQETFALTHPCNYACQCEGLFNPVCASETGISYFSPCHAGCAVNTDSNSWTSCSCSTIFNQTVNTVHKGWCEVPCQGTQIIFFSLFAMLAASVFALAPMIQSAAMRVVSFHHRDAFICFGWMFMRVFGSIPGAVLFGAVIDTTCMHWSTGCDGSTKCVLYDAKNLGFYIFLFRTIYGICRNYLLAISSQGIRALIFHGHSVLSEYPDTPILTYLRNGKSKLSLFELRVSQKLVQFPSATTGLGGKLKLFAFYSNLSFTGLSTLGT
ncbi:hypothetical protein Y032_0084g1713 [Ancylostoma ceylanicum]|uniref:Solute carrier organic anion transporter family member n=1 Tax=Ancylostoma ceylanicum TaxID=53326 RepID=A0A016TQG3_9BILA|nr:hypothetical protein Y032_0084g1713 [Ancylostoma ceylanicum]